VLSSETDNRGVDGDVGSSNVFIQKVIKTCGDSSGALTEKPMHQQDAYRMIQRRAKAAGIETKIGNHTFRATGITAYLIQSAG
jgi:integrase